MAHILLRTLLYRVLLWALAEAENSTCNPSSIENYEDMRYTVSRILKKLVADLPDSDLLSE